MRPRCFKPDETIRLEVRVESETVWLTQQQMAELFQITKQNVSLHVNNIFKEDELTESSVVKESNSPYYEISMCSFASGAVS